MSRLLTCGFEWGDSRADEISSGGTNGASSSAARSGTYGLRDQIAFFTGITTFVAGTTYYFRFYVRKSANPSTESGIFNFETAGGGGIRIFVKTNGDIDFRTVLGGSETSRATSALTNSQWYRVEASLNFSASAGSDDAVEFKLDGSTLYSASHDLTTTAPTVIRIGRNSGTGGNIDIDDVAINSSGGSDQNTWPGEGKVVLLRPISDSQDGSWVGGAGGSGIDLSLAVDNVPPAGVVSGSATNTSQIESADSSGNNTTDEYRANLQTYTTGGIGASDTVSAVQAIAIHGEDIATNTKTGSFGLQSNPANAGGGGETAFTFGADAGAINTWPTNWRTTYATALGAPSVTKGSSPVLAIRKTDAGTRVASVCAMGLYVDYVPVSALVLEQGFVDHMNPGVL